MNQRIETAAGLLAEGINFLLAASAGYVIIDDLAGGGGSLRELWLLFPIPLFYYGVRKLCPLLPLFLGLHLLPAAGMLFLYQEEPGKKLVMTGIVVLFALLSIRKRITSQVREMEAAFPPGAAGLMLALYLIDSLQGKGKNGVLILQMLIFFLTGYFMYLYLRQFLHYVDMNNRTTENIPVRHVFFSSLGLSAIYTVFSLLLLTLCSNREVIDGLGGALREGIRRLLSYLFTLKPGEVGIDPEQQAVQGGGMGFQLPPPEEPTLLGRILDVLLSVGALSLVLIAAAAGILALIRWFRSGFYRRERMGRKQRGQQEEQDKIERITQDKEEQGDKQNTLWHRLKEAASPEEKIRRIYKRAVKKGMPSLREEKLTAHLAAATARECCLTLFPEKETEACDFAGLYEKARYGAGICTGEDVKRARKLSGTLLGR